MYKPYSISYSSLNTLSECPLRYKYQYIDRVKVKVKSSIYGAFGTAIHSCIEQFYNGGIYDRKSLTSLWKPIFMKEVMKEKTEKVSNREIQRLLKQGYPMLQTFFSTQQSKGLLIKPIATELEFKINWKDIKIIGKIDIVFEKDGEIQIIDFKTTADKKQHRDKKKSLQLIMYLTAYRWLCKKFPKKYKNGDMKVYLHFLRPNIKNKFNIISTDRKRLFKELYQHLELLKTSKFKATPSYQSCKWCIYKSLCFKKKENEDILKLKLKKNVFKEGKNLLNYQIQDVKKMIVNKMILNSNDMGTGKSAEAIYVAKYLKNENLIKDVLILTTSSIKHQWVNEINKFVENSNITLIDGVKVKRKKLYYQRKFWTVISYSTFRADESFIKKEWDLIILDDPSIFKNWKAKTSKVLQKLKAKYKYILYATPIENNIMEIYNLIRWLDFSVLGRRDIFVERYTKRNFFGVITKYKNIQEFKERINNILIRRRFEDVVKHIPQTIIKNVYLDFFPEQKKLYNSMVKQLKEYLNNKLKGTKKRKIIDAETLAKFTYLREVCLSPLLVGVDNKSAKIEKLKEIVKKILPQKIVIFLEFAEMAKILNKKLENSIIVTGGDSAKEKLNKVKTFKNSKEYNILIATNVLTYGVNLQFAHHIINFDLPFTFSALSQRIGRERRIGQKYQVMVVNLVMANSIEKRMEDIINYKKKLTQIIDKKGVDIIDVPQSGNVTRKTIESFLTDK